MQNATHFIEIFSGNCSGISKTTPVMPIELLEETLAVTKDAPLLSTTAVFFIKPKPSVILATRDEALSTTLIEPA